MTEVVSQVVAAAKKEGFQRVLTLRLKVGDLAGVVPECLEFCFPEATRDTVLAGSRLEILRVPVRLRCNRCNRESSPAELADLTCSFCQFQQTEIIAGRELSILDLDVE